MTLIKTPLGIYTEIISGVPQGPRVGPILFNVFRKDFFKTVQKASAHNFAEDKTLSVFADYS